MKRLIVKWIKSNQGTRSWAHVGRLHLEVGAEFGTGKWVAKIRVLGSRYWWTTHRADEKAAKRAAVTMAQCMPQSRKAASTVRHRHSRCSHIRCPICAPLRCSKAP